MNIAQTILPLAEDSSWGMHDGGIGVGWLIVMVPMMLLMMGGMMWMMMRGMGGDSSPDSSAPSEGPGHTESPVEILERRFAEGAISEEEYRARRAALVNGSAEPSDEERDDLLTAPRAGGGS